MAKTWMERLKELDRQGRRHIYDTGPYPRCIGIWKQEEGPLLAQARRETDAPVAISEEWYPDFPDYLILYLTAPLPQPGELSLFWRAFEALQDSNPMTG